MKHIEESIHHITPLANVFLGDGEYNKQKMDHQDHKHLHKICDLGESFRETIDKLYAKVNNDLVLSLSSVDELYKQLWYFFKNFEKLPEHVRTMIWKKWWDIVVHHIDQRSELTGKHTCDYRKIDKTVPGERPDVVDHKTLQDIMLMDKMVLQDLVIEMREYLDWRWIPASMLQFSHKKRRNWHHLIPLMIYGRDNKYNQLPGEQSTHQHIYQKAMQDWTIRKRWARKLTNGSIVFGSKERELRWTVQRTYLRRVKQVLWDYYDDDVNNIYLWTIRAQLWETIAKRNTIKKTIDSDLVYHQRSRSLLGMHWEMIKVLWRTGDHIKELFVQKHRFV